MTVGKHLFLDDGDELGQILPLHFLALTVEVEPNVVNVRVGQCFAHLRELLSDAFLTSLFVNQVHEVLLLIVNLGFFDMLLCGLVRLIKVRVDYHRWCPRQSWLHLPQKWDRSTCLQVSSDRESTILLLLSQDVFRLTEVGCIALTVESTDDESTTHTSGIFP